MSARKGQVSGGPRIVEETFSHPANGAGGWYVRVRGTREQALDMLTLAEESALAHGWTADDRASAGWPSSYNLREEERSFSFYGKGTWAYHGDCWCRHTGCLHTSNFGPGCRAPAPYTRS